MYKLWRLFAVALMFGFAAFANAADKGSIKLGTLGWEDLTPLTSISKRFLEKQGYKVEVTTFADWGIAYSALTRGDVDVMISHVDYAAADYWTRNKERLEKVSVVSHGLRQGIVVPADMPINSIEQLNSVKDQVGGKIIGLEAGSGLMRETNAAVKEYGLQYTVVEGSTAAMTAQLQSTLERKQPIVAVLWKPSWMDQKFKVKFLDDPKGVFAPPQAYYWIAKKGFSASNSALREALATVYVPLEDNTQINGAIKDGKTLDQAVDEWMKRNSGLVDRWAVMSQK